MKRHAVLAVLGRPGTEAAMVARLLGARLHAEVVSVASAAAAEVEAPPRSQTYSELYKLWHTF